jgi:hypothetical protein
MRGLDGKFHITDSGQIVKTSNGEVVPEDEPLFLLRARDRLALPLLREYWSMCEDDDCTDYQMRLMAEVVDRFSAFAREHPDRMKQPGVTRGK